MLLVTALAGTSMWALIEARRTEQFKAAADQLQLECNTAKAMQEALSRLLEMEVARRQKPPLPVKGSVPDHWLEPPVSENLISD
jgi:hypothetical protein